MFFLAEFVHNFLYIVNLLSKQDIKHFSNIDMLGFEAIVFEKLYSSDMYTKLNLITEFEVFC